MGCQSAVFLGNNLTFSITTHDADTGNLTDADSAPPYRIYEGVTTPPILTGTMSKLDDANTTGFYATQIACTTANGFEVGKTYSIYIEAPVDSDTGGIPYTFEVYNARFVWTYATRELTRAASASTSAANDISIIRGDSWNETSISGLGDISDRTKLWITIKSKTSNLDSEAIVQITEGDGLVYLNGEDASARSAKGTVTVTDAGAGDITVTLDEAETDDLVPSRNLPYDVQMLDSSGDVTTLQRANCDITADVTRAIT